MHVGDPINKTHTLVVFIKKDNHSWVWRTWCNWFLSFWGSLQCDCGWLPGILENLQDCGNSWDQREVNTAWGQKKLKELIKQLVQLQLRKDLGTNSLSVSYITKLSNQMSLIRVFMDLGWHNVFFMVYLFFDRLTTLAGKGKGVVGLLAVPDVPGWKLKGWNVWRHFLQMPTAIACTRGWKVSSLRRNS